MSDVDGRWKKTETNGAVVEALDRCGALRLAVRPGSEGYTNAQIDDYRGEGGPHFQWQPPAALSLRARFSGEAGDLVGTAGFGFWNAPFGPGAGRGLRLPQAAWFFYASDASDLPLAPGDGKGNGWFASTIDASKPRALAWAPFILPVLLLNQVAAVRRMLWPIVRRDLDISFQRLPIEMGAWHQYQLAWDRDRTIFKVDGVPCLITPSSPRGPLGFVCWVDNQRLVATPRGRVAWGTEKVTVDQWLEVVEIRLEQSS